MRLRVRVGNGGETEGKEVRQLERFTIVIKQICNMVMIQASWRPYYVRL